MSHNLLVWNVSQALTCCAGTCSLYGYSHGQTVSPRGVCWSCFLARWHVQFLCSARLGTGSYPWEQPCSQHAPAQHRTACARQADVYETGLARFMRGLIDSVCTKSIASRQSPPLPFFITPVHHPLNYNMNQSSTLSGILLGSTQQKHRHTSCHSCKSRRQAAAQSIQIGTNQPHSLQPTAPKAAPKAATESSELAFNTKPHQPHSHRSSTYG